MRPFGELSVSISIKPEVFILPVAIEKMEIYVQQCDDEIGWLGYCTKNGNKYIIQDVELFNQEVNGTTCEIDEKCVAEFAEDLLSRPGGVDLCNAIRVWGHSHVNMGVSPSGQDEIQFQRLYNDSNDFYIRIIANKKGDMKVDLHDCTTGITYMNVQWVEYRDTSLDKQSIIQEIAHKVKKKVFNSPKYNQQNYSKYNSASIYGEDGYDTYDRGYWWGGNTQKKNNQPQSVNKKVEINDEIDSIYDITTPMDLVLMLDLGEDDIVMLADCDTVTAMELLNDAKINYNYMLDLDEANHIVGLCKEFIEKYSLQ